MTGAFHLSAGGHLGSRSDPHGILVSAWATHNGRRKRTTFGSSTRVPQDSTIEEIAKAYGEVAAEALLKALRKQKQLEEDQKADDE